MNEVYVVKRGDTLYGISNQFGVSVTELAELNGIKGDNLQIGQSLVIPSKSGTNPDNMFLYTVKRGDTLYNIARKYNVSVDSIKQLNYLKSDNLSIGQVIRIPEMYTKPDDVIIPNYINYTVTKGDTLYNIAKKYNSSVSDILKDNGLIDASLMIGQNLKIRVNKNDFLIEECFGESYVPSTDNSNTYVVKKGDSLYSIARMFQINVDDIKRYNGLNSNYLSVGQILRIPSDNKTYIVKRGNNLYSIANKFQSTVDSIKKKNNLVSNNLQIGQVLII